MILFTLIFQTFVIKLGWIWIWFVSRPVTIMNEGTNEALVLRYLSVNAHRDADEWNQQLQLKNLLLVLTFLLPPRIHLTNEQSTCCHVFSDPNQGYRFTNPSTECCELTPKVENQYMAASVIKVWEMMRFIRMLQRELETHKRFKIPNKKKKPNTPINKKEDHKCGFQDKTANFWSGPLLWPVHDPR